MHLSYIPSFKSLSIRRGRIMGLSKRNKLGKMRFSTGEGEKKKWLIADICSKKLFKGTHVIQVDNECPLVQQGIITSHLVYSFHENQKY